MADPQALHAEIMAFDEADVILSPVPFLSAVRAVMELHKPDRSGTPAECEGCRAVQSDSDWTVRPYPCATVKVIATALGVATDG